MYERSTATLRYMAEWAERKAEVASASPDPWSMRNMRLYQNLASKWWGEYYARLREEVRS